MNIKKNNNVICIAKIIAKKNKLEEVLRVFAELKRLSPKETGCIRYELHQNQDNPLDFTFIDRFKDLTAFDFHCEQEYTKKYFDEILPSITESIEITLHNEIEIY